MRLKINGELVDNVRAETITELLEEMNIPACRVAVEVNLVVVKKTEYGDFKLSDGDTVEIVNFVGGG